MTLRRGCGALTWTRTAEMLWWWRGSEREREGIPRRMPHMPHMPQYLPRMGDERGGGLG